MIAVESLLPIAGRTRSPATSAPAVVAAAARAPNDARTGGWVRLLRDTSRRPGGALHVHSGEITPTGGVRG